MKVCPDCETRFAGAGWSCPTCGSTPARDGGILRLAAAGTLAVQGYAAGYLEELAELEHENFWYRSRNALITWALDRYVPSARTFVEVGCGNGVVLDALATARPEMELTGVEPFVEGLEVARRRVPAAEFVQADARRLPWESEFDAAGAFDVIEHIAEDERVLRQLHTIVRPGGGPS